MTTHDCSASGTIDATRSFYDRISRVYDLMADRSEGACRERGLEALGVRSGDRVLEIGFGTGHGLVSLARSVGTRGRVCGVDVSCGMLAVAQERVRTINNVMVTIADGRALCFRAALFDAAFLSFTLELFDASGMSDVLRDVARVLRPGGRLGLVCMSSDAQPNAMEGMYRWLHRHFPHFVDCRPIDAVDLLARNGFDIVSTERMTIWGLAVICVVARNPPQGSPATGMSQKCG